MTHRGLFAFLLPAALALVSTTPVCAQAPSKTTPSAKKWSVGRTSDGQPDLEGVWDAASMTPLERPVELGNKEFYTPEEIAAYEKKRAHDLDRDRRDGSAEADLGRAYNDGWFDRGAHLASDRRTSRVIDPPNGRFPAMTPAAAKKYEEMHAWLVQHADDGPETRMLPDRCLVFSQSGPPFLPRKLQQLLSDRAGSGRRRDSFRNGAPSAHDSVDQRNSNPAASAREHEAMAR